MAARIAGVTLPDNKRIVISLTYVYGIGNNQSKKIVTKAGIDPNIKTKELSEKQVNDLRDIIEKDFTVEGELRREVSGNVKRLRDINSYRGSRHTKNLPVRGQRSKTNSRTVRGNVRKTMGSGRRNAADKT